MVRRVLVTDADHFLGPGVIERFRAEGDEVLALDRPLSSRADAVAVMAEHGPFDVVIANLECEITVAPVVELSEAEASDPFTRLVQPLFWLLGATVPLMVEAGGGAIVVPTSATALRSSSHPIAPYEAARAAQIAVVRSAAKELAGSGIRINATAPNFIENPSYFPPETVADPDFQRQMQTEMPARRLGSAAEAAAVVWWLASYEASYVHGAVIPTDGGWRLG